MPPVVLEPVAPEVHGVQFYREDSALLDTLSLSIGTSLVAGDSAIVIATKAHREDLASRLKIRGLDPALVIAQGRLLLLDAHETLARFTINGLPDEACFAQSMGPLIDRLSTAALGPNRRVTAFGEMVAVLWADGKRQAALQLEQLWNQLAVTHPFDLHCAYPIDLFAHSDSESIRQICAEHSHVVPADSSTSPDDVHSLILQQQQARDLDTETRNREKSEDAVFRLAAIVESSDDAIISKDLNGIVSSWNQSAERILGYKAEEIIGKSINLLIPPELQQQEVEILRKLRAGERIEHFETVRVTKYGDRLDVSLTVSPVKDRYGKITGAAKILRDVTQQKKLEMALHTTERLASVGRLAATVAHEINNPLEAVLNSVYLAQHQPDISEETRAYLDLADKELVRVAHIAQQTLGFYRDNSQPVSLDLQTVIADVITIYEGKLRCKFLHLEKRIQPGVTVVTLQGELKQILSNLLANAIDASTERGRIILTCRTFQKPCGADGVRITIADNGTGISPANQQKLFAPFFTTKRTVGTGLGLWITKDLLERHGGSIRLRSSTGAGHSGTVISIFLPASAPTP